MGAIPDNLGFPDSVAGAFNLAADSLSIRDPPGFGESQSAALP